MTDSNWLRDRLRLLGARGTIRGADAVLATAMATADSSAGQTDGVDVDDADLDIGVIDMAQARRRRRHPAWSVLAAAGVAALAGVGALAISALVGDAGASSPEEAVRRLAEAVGAEDPLAAAGALAPEEVRTLRATLDRASRKAAELDLVEAANAPLAGVDLDIHDLDLATEELAPGYAKVTILEGDLTAETDSSAYSDLLRRAGADDVSGGLGAAELRREDTQPFVVAVERDGGWYVSAAYTALEYVRVLNDLPAADYGSGIARAATLGAASPEDAARQMVSSLADADWEGVFSLVPPEEIALYDYRSPLAELLSGTGGFTVDDLDAKSEIHGDTATVEVRASGRLRSGGENDFGPTEWELSDGCLRERFPGYSGMYSETGSIDAADADAAPDSTHLLSVYCNSPPSTGSPLFMLLGGFDTQPPDPGRGVELAAVRIGDRWFLSPVTMALDIIDGWVGSFDTRSLYSMLGLAREIPPEAQLALGEPYNGESARRGVAYTFTFQGRADQKIVGRLASADAPSARRGNLWSGSSEVYGADGSLLEDAYGVIMGIPVTLPDDGAYTLVVSPIYAGPYELTLWDADEAPAGVIDTERIGYGQECTVSEDGGVECSISLADGAESGEECPVSDDGGVECTSSEGSSSGCIYNGDGTSECWDSGSGSSPTAPVTSVPADPGFGGPVPTPAAGTAPPAESATSSPGG